MTTHTLPYLGWRRKLSDAIEAAKSGDIVQVHSDSMKMLAERGRARMCPEKTLTFEIVPQPDPFELIYRDRTPRNPSEPQTMPGTDI